MNCPLAHEARRQDEAKFNIGFFSDSAEARMQLMWRVAVNFVLGRGCLLIVCLIRWQISANQFTGSWSSNFRIILLSRELQTRIQPGPLGSPNEAVHATAARLRMLPNVKGSFRAAARDGER